MLYVDRNGNGDLTDEGEKIAAAKQTPCRRGGSAGSVRIRDRRNRRRIAGAQGVALRHGDDRAYRTLRRRRECVSKEHPQGRGFIVSCEVEIAGRKGAGTDGRLVQIAGPFDLHGVLQFAEKPADAPIIHFGGPWQVSLYNRHELKIGRQKEITLAIGTPGFGPGTTACVAYEGCCRRTSTPVWKSCFPPPARDRFLCANRTS